MIRRFVTGHTGKGNVVNDGRLASFIRTLGAPHIVLLVMRTNPTISRLANGLFPLVRGNSVLVSKNGSCCRSARHHMGRLCSGKVCFMNYNVSKNRRNTLRKTSVVPNNTRRT